MDALIDQFAAARKRGVGAPLPIIASAAAMSVARAQMHQRTKRASIDERADFLQRGMQAMIVTNPNADACICGSLMEHVQLDRVERTGLFDEDMFTGANCRKGDWCERGVERGD